jgi:2-keto-4-pentenoate hydratase/2-oxohepta-3-ene-1,7-dioic acid hydratase in catechol pathway
MQSIIYDSKAVFPSKIVCVGRNYVAHVQELNNDMPEEPVIFIKPNNAIARQPVALSGEVIHYEAEIAFLISAGRLAGIGLGLDLTKRDLQTKLKAKGLPWERAKAFDNSAVFSDFIPLTADIDTLRLELFINNSLVQQGGYQQMINKPEALLQEAMTFLTFEEGDILMTGTPKGVGAVHRGDRYTGKLYAGNTLLLEAGWLVE